MGARNQGKHVKYVSLSYLHDKKLAEMHRIMERKRTFEFRDRCANLSENFERRKQIKKLISVLNCEVCSHA